MLRCLLVTFLWIEIVGPGQQGGASQPLWACNFRPRWGKHPIIGMTTGLRNGTADKTALGTHWLRSLKESSYRLFSLKPPKRAIKVSQEPSGVKPKCSCAATSTPIMSGELAIISTPPVAKMKARHCSGFLSPLAKTQKELPSP